MSGIREQWDVTDPPGGNGEEISVFEVVDGKPITVACVDNPDELSPGDDGWDKLAARAYMIAAAPDLLAALAAWMEPFPDAETDEAIEEIAPGAARRIRAARAAIAKAAGVAS